ncbi:MAG: CoA-acylating methylmalonate-semialdehyde dehydrogenase [Phycisphaerae bacterium]|nr:CoA-acylating methylmalonate-semialdehyde dehydrogenase [Phycisphaerae bacterium]
MPTAMLDETNTCRIFSGGKWLDSQATRFGEVTNSSTGEVIARVPFCTAGEVDRVVQTSHEAFAEWSETPAVQRARIMFNYLENLKAAEDDMARIMSREHGKTFAESKASVQRGMEMVEFACGLPSLLMGDSIENLAHGVDCETHRHPLGVCVGITPFNFPAMVPMWMFPIALVCGNTFVLKPSEKVPFSAMREIELLHDAGLPEGVISVVHGDKECVDALLTHPLVQAVSFVGSTPVAKYIYETGTAHGKRVQAAGGAKNHILVMPDAILDQSVNAVVGSAFGCAGERCMAGPLVLPVGDVADEVVERVTQAAAKLKTGPTDRESNATMGPLITQEHKDLVIGYIEKGQAEGAKLTLDGRKVSVPEAPGGYYLGPTVFDRVTPEMAIAREEIFGPVLSVVRIKSLEEGIRMTQESEYGNGAVIYTQNGRAAREFQRRAGAGMIGINVGVPAPMAWFSFTGWCRSFFGDLHIQAKEGMMFYTQQKMTMSRWFKGTDGALGTWGF